jgi:hypothetical protein
VAQKEKDGKSTFFACSHDFPCVPVDSFGVKLQSSSCAVIAVKCLQVAQTLEAACYTARADQRQHGGSVRKRPEENPRESMGGDVILGR